LKQKPTRTLAVIEFGIREVLVLLAGIGPHCINTWVPHISNHQPIIIKIVRNMVPEFYGKKLPSPVYSVLTKEEYVKNEEVHDCTCR
jgi:hypothetical protein